MERHVERGAPEARCGAGIGDEGHARADTSKLHRHSVAFGGSRGNPHVALMWVRYAIGDPGLRDPAVADEVVRLTEDGHSEEP